MNFLSKKDATIIQVLKMSLKKQNSRNARILGCIISDIENLL